MKRAGLTLLALLLACSPSPGPLSPTSSPDYLGSQRCAACHQAEMRAWQGSHHDLAMQEPTEKSVLGDFENATFTSHGVSTTFFRRDGGWWVRTEGKEHKVRYVFGVEPLQQLLLELPGGKLQALSVAWDERKKRWLHLYPEEKIGPEDELHWTARAHNWNHMCADCHSTRLVKGYQPDSGHYDTRSLEINVACEACHGPGRQHPEGPGLPARLTPPPGRFQKTDPETGSPRPEDNAYARREADLCARCHSRRHQFRDEWTPGDPLLDAFVPSLLESDLYEADGQQQDEVYSYASFLQSKMYRAGVACSDCHDPHSLELRDQGNALCLRCHQADRFDRPGHTHHPTGSPGAQCVECHAPTRVYMQVDARRDHSFRVPRPDLSLKYGTPNACNQCHQDKSTRWAADWFGKWYSDKPRPHFVEDFQAARLGAPGSDARLVRLADDKKQSEVVRATALSLLAGSPRALQALLAALKDPDPLLRLAATRRLAALPPDFRVQALSGVLGDPVRAVRMEAAAGLAGSASQLSEPQQKELERALAEYLEAQLRNADLPESHLNRGLLLLTQGKPAEAEEAYREALRLDPAFTPASVNLADLLREQGQDDRAEPILRQALELCPDHNRAEVYHALGLLEIRQKKPARALQSLAEAYRRRPDGAGFALVYALALEQAGRKAEALQVLRKRLLSHPYDPEALTVMTAWLGSTKEGQQCANRLLELQKQ
ncbi:tetratricopeptide repeat protein [bacterium CPR1]|nr:tetratricopeptide repeat protein [bacterium CPR1]